MSTTPLKRRGAILSTTLLSAALVLSACGSDSDATTDGPDDAAASAETHTVTAGNGSVEVPVDPQRVVTIGGTAQPFIDLGGTPIAASPYYAPDSLPEDQQAVFAAATEIGEEVDLEELAGLEPDLILVQSDDAGFEAIETELEQIAPTVFWDLATEWKEMAAGIAEAGNVGDTLDAQTAEFEALTSGIQETYADLIADTSFVDVSRYSSSDPGTFVIADIGCSEVGRDDVGLDLPQAAEGEDPLAYTSLPYERISDLAEYDVITYPLDEDGQPKEDFVPVLETNTWKALPQVASGHAVGVFCPGNGSYGQVNRYLESLDAALASLPAAE